MRIGRLHIITDIDVQHRYTHAELAEHAIAGGADTIQYRSKSLDVAGMLHEAGAVREVCRARGVPIIINDRVDVCLAIEADGVHLGRGDMPIDVARRLLGPGFIIGGTARTVEHVLEARRLGADYVGVGPVFGTTTKQVDHVLIGLDGVRSIADAAALPVIAIAGITHRNAGQVLQAGADGVAVISDVCAAVDVRAAAERLAHVVAAVGTH